MTRRRDPFPTQGRTLNRYQRHTEAAADRQKIARILAISSPEDTVGSTTRTFVDHTDYQRLRGLPAIGRNVAGSIPGLKPGDPAKDAAARATIW